MAKPQQARNGHPPKDFSRKWLPEGVEIRAIGISIPGYDARAVTREQKRKGAERAKRLSKRAARQREEQQRADQKSAEEIEAFAQSMGTPDTEVQLEKCVNSGIGAADATQHERDLIRAFGVESRGE